MLIKVNLPNIIDDTHLEENLITNNINHNYGCINYMLLKVTI